RGYYTGWLQTSPTLGIVVSLATIIGIRTYLGVEAFNDWGWRIPFIISLLLVAIAIWIRLSLGETPIFQDMKARGRTTTNPWREAFLSNNFKYVAIRSEEHTSELQSRGHLVCRLLLEKKKQQIQ